MKYKVLSPLVYAGTVYNAEQEVDIIENTVAKDCIDNKSKK